MSYQPHLSRGGELYHGRKAISEGGSPNGFSKTPGYTAKGKKRVGRFVGYSSNGTPIYDYSVRQAPTGNGGGGQRRNQNIFERAGSAVSGAANRIGRNVSGAAGSVGNWLRNRARDVSGAANRVGRAIGKAWDGKAGAGTGLNLRNERLTKSVTTRDKAQSAGYREAADAAKRDYDNSIVGRFNSARNAVGNWLGNRGRDVSRLAGRAGRAIGKAWDGKAGAGTGLDLRNERLTKSVTTRDKAQSAGYREAADVAKRDYDNSIVGRFNSAKRAVAGAAKSAGDWIGNRGRDVSRLAGRAGRAIGKAWDGKAGKGTGLDLRNERLTKSVTTRDKAQSAGYREAADVAKRDYDRSIVGTANRLLNRAGSAVRGAGSAISSGARRIGDAAGDLRDNTVGAVRTYKQNRKNSKNAAGGREAQQAKGSKLNVQQSKQAHKEAERNYNAAKKELRRLSDEMEKYSPNDPKFYDAQKEYTDYYNEVYTPASRAYNAGKPKKK